MKLASELEAHLLSARFHLNEAAKKLPEKEKLLAQGAAMTLEHLIKETVTNSSRPARAEVQAPDGETPVQPPPFIFGAGYEGAEKKKCPTCGARPGEACVAKTSRLPQRLAHSARRNW
jgi:hypothetical protein